MSEAVSRDLDFSHFIRSVLDALEAADVEYMIGGAVAVWAWGDVRTTRGLDVVIKLQPGSIPALSQELEKRDMLVPVDSWGVLHRRVGWQKRRFWSYKYLLTWLRCFAPMSGRELQMRIG